MTRIGQKEHSSTVWEVGTPEYSESPQRTSQLTDPQYRVPQQDETEPSNAYWDNGAPGTNVDVVSGEPAGQAGQVTDQPFRDHLWDCGRHQKTDERPFFSPRR